jgi:prepilin-type N-terminal cleavage/methylation domain-containing protein
MQFAGIRTATRGFSLIEVMLATTILMVISAGVAQLFAMAARANAGAKAKTTTSALAMQRMEQLRGLTWAFDSSDPGRPLSDTTTDLSVDPPTVGGRGLAVSPPGTLWHNTPGYVDYLDQFGTWVGTGAAPPLSATYIRRWSIDPLPASPNDTLVLQVMVTSVVAEAAYGSAGLSSVRRRLNDDARIVSVKTRRSP